MEQQQQQEQEGLQQGLNDMPTGALAPSKEIPGMPYRTWTYQEDRNLMTRYNDILRSNRRSKQNLLSCMHPDCVADNETLRMMYSVESGSMYARDHWRMCHMAVGCRMILTCPLYNTAGTKPCNEEFQGAWQLERHIKASPRNGGHVFRGDPTSISNLVRLLWQHEDINNRTLYWETLSLRGALPTDIGPFLLRNLTGVIHNLGLEHKLANEKPNDNLQALTTKGVEQGEAIMDLFNCQLCGVPGSQAHFASPQHCERYLLKEQIVGLADFQKHYGRIPFLMQDPKGETLEQIGKDDPLEVHLFRSMVVKNGHCAMCKVDVKGGYTHWRTHMGGKKHSTAFLREMDERNGMEGFRERFGCLPIPPPDKIMEFTNKVQPAKKNDGYDNKSGGLGSYSRDYKSLSPSKKPSNSVTPPRAGGGDYRNSYSRDIESYHTSPSSASVAVSTILTRALANTQSAQSTSQQRPSNTDYTPRGVPAPSSEFSSLSRPTADYSQRSLPQSDYSSRPSPADYASRSTSDYPPRPSPSDYPPRPSPSDYPPRPSPSDYPPRPSPSDYPPRPSPSDYPPRPTSDYTARPSASDYAARPSASDYAARPSPSDYPQRSLAPSSSSASIDYPPRSTTWDYSQSRLSTSIDSWPARNYPNIPASVVSSRLPIGPRLLDNEDMLARQQEKLQALKSEKEKLRLELEEQKELAEKQTLMKELEETKKRNADMKALEEAKKLQNAREAEAALLKSGDETLTQAANAYDELQVFLPSQSSEEKKILQVVITRLNNLCDKLKAQRNILSVGLLAPAEFQKTVDSLNQLVTQVATLLAASKVTQNAREAAEKEKRAAASRSIRAPVKKRKKETGMNIGQKIAEDVDSGLDFLLGEEPNPKSSSEAKDKNRNGSSSSSSSSKRTLFVKEIPEQFCDHTRLMNHFEVFGKVHKLDVDKKKCTATVYFDQMDDARKANDQGHMIHPAVPNLKILWASSSSSSTSSKSRSYAKPAARSPTPPPRKPVSPPPPAINDIRVVAKVPDSSFCEICSEILPNEKERKAHYILDFTNTDANKDSQHGKNYLKAQMTMGLSKFYERFSDVPLEIIDNRVTAGPGLTPSAPSPFSEEKGYDQFVWSIGVVNQFFCSVCKLRVSPGQDKVRTWFAHVHRRGHLETYLYLRKDHNLSQLIAEYGLFVIPTMPLVQKVMMETPQFKTTFASLPWDRYLGNWYSTPSVSPTVPPVVSGVGPLPVSMPGVVAASVPGAIPGVIPGPRHPGAAMFGGITAWAANQPWLQQQMPPRHQMPPHLIPLQVPPPHKADQLLPPGEGRVVLPPPHPYKTGRNTEPCSVVLKGLPFSYRKGDLVAMTEKFGAIVRAELQMNPEQSRCLGLGYVEYSDPRMAQNALDSLTQLKARVFITNKSPEEIWRENPDGDRRRSRSPSRRSLSRQLSQSRRGSPHSRQSSRRRSPLRRSPRRSPGRRSPGRRSPGRRSPGRRSPGRRSPGRRSPGRRSPGRRSPGRSPGRRSPGRRSPGRRSPGSPPRIIDHRYPRRSPLRSKSPSSRRRRSRSPTGRKRSRSPSTRSHRRSPSRKSKSPSTRRRRSRSAGKKRSRSPVKSSRGSSRSKKSSKSPTRSSKRKSKSPGPGGEFTVISKWDSPADDNPMDKAKTDDKKKSSSSSSKKSTPDPSSKNASQEKGASDKIQIKDVVQQLKKQQDKKAADKADLDKMGEKLRNEREKKNEKKSDMTQASVDFWGEEEKKLKFTVKQVVPLKSINPKALPGADDEDHNMEAATSAAGGQSKGNSTAGRKTSPKSQPPNAPGKVYPGPPVTRAMPPAGSTHPSMAAARITPQVFSPAAGKAQAIPQQQGGQHTYNGKLLPPGVTPQALESATDVFCKILFRFLEILFGEKGENLPKIPLGALDPSEQVVAKQLEKGLRDPNGLNRIVHGIRTLNTLPTEVVQLLGLVDPLIVSEVADKRGFKLANMTPGQLLGLFMSGEIDDRTLEDIRLDFKVQRQLDMLSHLA